MSDIIVVGICGRARSGKDTAARVLVLHRDCHRLALADPIKAMLTPDLIKDLTQDHNYRRANQMLGTESRDAVNAPGLWVHALLAQIHYLSFIHPVPRCRFVIPDIRYRHEESMIRFQVARWRGRFGALKLIRGSASIAESGHSSETEVDNVPCSSTYYNDRGIEELIYAACEFFDLVSESSQGVA